MAQTSMTQDQLDGDGVSGLGQEAPTKPGHEYCNSQQQQMQYRQHGQQLDQAAQEESYQEQYQDQYQYQYQRRYSRFKGYHEYRESYVPQSRERYRMPYQIGSTDRSSCQRSHSMDSGCSSRETHQSRQYGGVGQKPCGGAGCGRPKTTGEASGAARRPSSCQPCNDPPTKSHPPRPKQQQPQQQQCNPSYERYHRAPPDTRRRPRRSHHVARQAATSSGTSVRSARSRSPCYDTASVASSQAAPRWQSPPKSCCEPCFAPPEKKRSKPEPFCAPCSQPQQQQQRQSRSQSRRENRREQPRESRCRSLEEPPKKPKDSSQHCKGCYEPRPLPEYRPKPRSNHSETSCECSPEPYQPRCNHNCENFKSTDYVEYRQYAAPGQRNPLVVRSRGCLSHCPTQGGSIKQKAKPKPRNTHGYQSCQRVQQARPVHARTPSKCPSQGYCMKPTEQRKPKPNYDKHGFKPCQSTHPPRPVQSTCSLSSQGQRNNSSAMDYAELSDKSGRYVRNPLTVSRCSCNMQARPEVKECPGKSQPRKQTPYCSYDTIQGPTKSCNHCNNTPKSAQSKPHKPPLESEARCNRCNRRKPKVIACPAFSLPPLVHNSQGTNFVPQNWFNGPNMKMAPTTHLNAEGSCSDLEADDSSLQRKTQQASASQSGCSPQLKSTVERRRCTQPKRHLSGCNTFVDTKREIHLTLKTRRFCPSKLITRLSAQRMPLTVLSTRIRRFRLSKALSHVCAGIRVKQRRQRCRGGKLTPAANSAQSAKTIRPKTRVSLTNSNNRPTPASGNLSPSRMQTAARRERSQSQGPTQRPQYVADPPPAPRPKPPAPARRDPAQRGQQPSRTNGTTVQPAPSGGRRSTSQPARNAQAPEAYRRDRVPTRNTSPVRSRDRSPDRSQEWSLERMATRTPERAQARLAVRMQQAPERGQPEEWSGSRSSSWSGERDEEQTSVSPQRTHKKMTMKQITTQRPQFLRDGQVQPVPGPVIHTHSRSGCLGTNIHHFYRGSFLTVRNVTDDVARSSSQVPRRTRGSLIEVAQHMLQPKLLKRSVPRGSAFVVPNKWSCMPLQMNSFNGASAIVELADPKDSNISTKTNWSWRRLFPSWLLSKKTTSA